MFVWIFLQICSGDNEWMDDKPVTMITTSCKRLRYLASLNTWVDTVQLTSKLTLACGEHAWVLQFSNQNTHVTQNGLHASQLSCACELFFVCCTRVIICVLHDSKKHASNALCAACELVSLHAARKLIAIFSQRRIKAYNETVPQQSVIKHVDTNKIIFCQVFTYRYSNPL